MFRRAGAIGFALALAGCVGVDRIVLDDVHVDGSADAIVPKDAAPDSDATCNQSSTPLPFKPQTPQLLILLDRSSDMQSSFDGTTREAAVQDALVGAIKTFQGKIKLGFEQFPVDPAVSPCAPNSCCADKVVDPALNNATTMEIDIGCTDPNNTSCSVASTDSPSYAALEQARDYYKAEPATTDEQDILLVTSSEPSCAGAADNPCSSALSAANDLGNLSVRIFVLSVDYQPPPWSCLSQFPRGGSSPHDSLMYTANDSSSLGTKLNTIFSKVAQAACTLNLSSVDVPPQAGLQVSMGKDSVPQLGWTGGQDGYWANNNNTSITLSGSACNDYLISQGKLVVRYTWPIACNQGWP